MRRIILTTIYFALAAALAADTTNEARAKTKVAISPKLFSTFVRYTNVTSASAVQPCAKPPYGAVAVGYINETSTDTQASVFRDDIAKEYILGVPGTASTTDDLTDLMFDLVPYIAPGISCDGCFVHAGFLSAWNSIASQVETLLRPTLKKDKKYKIVVVGHSLGAAIAQLAYASLKSRGFPMRSAYTVGQPRIGNAVYANFVDGLSGATRSKPGDFFRITHAADPIPGLPPPFLGYRHSRTEYWESGKTVQNASTTYRCFGQEPQECSDSHQDLSQGDDHVEYSNIVLNGHVCGQ